jgi:NAD(P)-dependent dehydrogenase (short-subunit alcohol dehydrogenase family)
VSLGPETTTKEVINGVDLSGKTALVTGASAGLGVETTRALASAGAHVVMGVRDTRKGEGAADAIRSDLPAASLELAEVDLASLASIRAFADDFLPVHPRLDLLINNAGVMAPPLGRTAEGFELQIGTNHLGHFLLTGLLTPALIAGAPSRIVNVSSRGHLRGQMDWDDPHWRTRDYDKWTAYGQSKTANILFTVELERRLGAKGVHAYALHPGVIMTELSRYMDDQDIADLRSRMPQGVQLTFKSVEAGAATEVWAATSPELEGRGGIYLEDCHVAAPANAEGTQGYALYAVDPDAARRLWVWSEGEVGQTFSGT